MLWANQITLLFKLEYIMNEMWDGIDILHTGKP